MTRLSLGFLFLFGALQAIATGLASTRGEWGLVVALAIVAAAIVVQGVLHGEDWRGLGLGPPKPRGVLVAIGACAALLCIPIVYAGVTKASFVLWPNAAWLALGIFAQAGIAEELVFRGYLFGRLRRTRTFWRAALVSMAPFTAAHILLLFIMPWPIALTALALSVAVSFPLAHLYELGGRTIWAPALAHAVVQAGPKLFAVDGAHALQFALIWMAATIPVLWLTFLVRQDRNGAAP